MTFRAMNIRSGLLAILQIGGAALAVLVLTCAATPDDQDESKSRDADELRETASLIQAELPHWKIAVGERATELKLSPRPLLRWTNPATGRVHGEIYVWTAEGRPEAVFSLYKGWEPKWGFCGEIQSLSLTNLVARRDQAVVWKSDKPGITQSDVPDAPAIAETPSRRLQQMRAMANDFSAVLIDYRRNRDGERQSLRLLTQPVHRYSNPKADIVDGALYAFVLGTDAEVILVLEARGAKGEARWQYALARLNSDDLAASFKEQEVWRVGRARYEDRNEPYVFMSLSEPLPHKTLVK
jgi:hypothetical protein